MIRVNLLGTLAIYGPHGEISMPTTKACLMTAYLFCHQGQWVERARLRGLLWPDIDEERAASSLRTALYHLRRTLIICGTTANSLETKHDTVRIAPYVPAQVDAMLFEEKARQGLSGQDGDITALKAAAELYQGEFLRNLDVEWCDTERQRLADLHVTVLRTLVERLTEADLFDVALPYARRWLETDPLDETAHQAIMILHANLNQRGKVVAQFEKCRRVLEEELGVAPSDTTLQLLRRLGPFNLDGKRQTPRQASSQIRASAPSASSARPRFSDDPLLNARMLLSYAVSQAESGETEIALAATNAAMATYDQLSDRAMKAKAQLILGQMLLETHMVRLGQQAAKILRAALAYYREAGPPSDRHLALALYARALLYVGDTGQAIAVTQERIALANSAGDRETEARVLITLTTAYRGEHRLHEARQITDHLAEMMPAMHSTEAVIYYLIELGSLLFKAGDLEGAERALNQAVSLGPFIFPPTPAAKYHEWRAQRTLHSVLLCRGVNGLSEPSNISIDTIYHPRDGSPRQFSSLMSGDTSQRAVASTRGWLRAKWDDLPAHELISTIWLVVERMINVGFLREAGTWAAVGIRLARRREWTAWEAALSARRAVVLAKQRRTQAAMINLRRANSEIDAGDALTVAWSTWADGLLALSHQEASYVGQLMLAHQLFADLGHGQEAGQVATDLDQSSAK